MPLVLVGTDGVSTRAWTWWATTLTESDVLRAIASARLSDPCDRITDSLYV